MDTPLVSIITALHNKAPYVEETIRSVLAQTISNWEMIVVENGSTDRGPDLVRQFSDARIRLVVSPKCGPGAARNFGMRLATGAWILFLDADDLVEPKHLATLLEGADRNPQAGVVAGGWKEFRSDSPAKAAVHRPATFGFSQPELLAGAAALAPWILHAALVKNSILTDRNRWPEHLDPYPDEDTAFWFAVLLDARVAWVDQSGALYRRFAANSRSDSKNGLERAQGYSRIVEHNLAEAGKRRVSLSPTCYGNVSMMFEVRYRAAIETGDKVAAEFALRNATAWLRKCPSTSWHVRFRKWLGIPAVQYLRGLAGRDNGSNEKQGPFSPPAIVSNEVE
jgi:glycosyltransferase involved in cell wall biosynthesis